MERYVAPTMLHIVGDEAQDIEPSDDPARDALNVAEAWESLAGASLPEHDVDARPIRRCASS